MRRNGFILYFICIITLLAGCKEEQPADFSRYISGYSSGMLTSSSPIRIYLTMTPDKNFQAGSALPPDILSISPAVKGEVVLKADNSIEFTPAEPLKNGRSYEVTFRLGDMCQVDKEFERFTFGFDVIALSTIFEAGKLLAEENGEEESLRYQGALHCSDFIKPAKVEQMVRASYRGTNLKPEWQHDGNRHYFRFNHLEKDEKAQTLHLSFSREVSKGKECEIQIPGRNDFTVLDVESSDSYPAVISIYMSEPVEPDQDLNGLISIRDITLNNFSVENNIIRAYLPSSYAVNIAELSLFPGIRSTNGNTLESEYATSVSLRSTKPEVKFIGKGVIVPDRNKVLVPFSAVGLKAVDLEIIQVLNQNMNFFLQENTYASSSDLIRTARPIFMKKIDLLQEHPHVDTGKWNDFVINLSELVPLEQGAVYRIALKFKKSYTCLDCADEAPDSDYGSTDWNHTNDYAYYSEYSYPRDYEWEERNDPRSISYYTGDRFAYRNIINTSLGVMAKRGADNRYHVCVTDLASADPVSNCRLILYNYQNQSIDSAETDKDGFAVLNPESKAFVVLAQKGKDRAWLKLSDGNALSLSNFDVSGQHVQMGVKGFVYGERGVWRPGDEIHLSLILEDKMGMLPAGHPIVAQLTNPNGYVTQTQKGRIGKNNIHTFTFKTEAEAQTGYWHALFRIGGLTFRHTVRIETIKPNRLAIQMDFPHEQVLGKGIGQSAVKVSTRWLNGAPTAKQKAMTEVRLYHANAGFSTFPTYTFSDRSRHFEAMTTSLFDGTTDATGSFSFNTGAIKTDNAPGLLQAVFTTRVFENSGDFSISSQSLKYSPYTEYVGLRLPESEDNWYSTESPVRLEGVTVTPAGKAQGNSTVRIEVYKLDWRWWWDSRDEYLGSYVNREYSKSVLNKTVKAVNGKFSTELNIDVSGRYFIRATSPSGHTTGLIAYFGSWGENTNPETATMLHLSTDKESYQVGETIRVQIPPAAGAVAIVSLENGKTVDQIHRLPLKAGETTVFEVKATSDLCPNTYIAASLIQPHNNRDNDCPIRMYGVVNVQVEDPSLRLNPEIKVADKLRPGQAFKVEVKEKAGREMNYTVAIVDEGLLSLTGFRTPNPFSAFYAREALGVKTWDYYDYLYGAYGARLDKAFAVGGDEALKEIQDEKTNRFKPVVLFAGPFTLKAGEAGRHTFQMPEYIGEVRTMVIAATNGKYGSAAVQSKVSKPLMTFLALPRLLSPGDETNIPVTVFALKDDIREVTVRMKTDDKITLTGSDTQTVRFDKKGEQVVYFKARINAQTGVSSIRAEAVTDNEKAVVTEDVTIRIPNPRITRVEAKELKPGESITFDKPVAGAEASSVLEISSIPALNLEQRLTYLLDYPHGCAEQITSKAFPQLSLPDLLVLSPEQRMQAESHVREVIHDLLGYTVEKGGFSYWPGGRHASSWVTSYVVHFLVAAKSQGYFVSEIMLQNAIHYLEQEANAWHRSEPWEQQEQAYRLYVLALAGHADMAAMNRLKESPLQRPVSHWLLASAYMLSHQEEIAAKMINNLSTEVVPYRETGRTYGSTMRDNALILQSMVILNRQQDAYRMLEKISRTIGTGEWCSTQETSFALHAASQFVRKYLGSQRGVQVHVTTTAGKKEIRGDKTVWQVPLQVKNEHANATVRNEGEGTLFVRRVSTSALPEIVTEQVASGLAMNITYYNTQGTPVNVARLKQGEDITVEITVKNTGVIGTYQELALNYPIPSGFEIINERLTGHATMPEADNFDIRDDRFYVYFDLEQGRSKTFRFRCNAAFRGAYMLPAVRCSAMYDNNIQAVLPGGKTVIE